MSTLILSTTFSFPSYSNQQAQHECDSVLALSVVDTYKATKSTSHKEALQKAFCADSFSENDQINYHFGKSSQSTSSNGGGGGSLNVFGLFNIGGSGGDVSSSSLSKEHIDDLSSFEEKRNHICSHYDFDNQYESQSDILKQSSQALLEEWGSCMDRDYPSPLVCRLKKVNYKDKTAEIKIIYRGGYGSAKQVQHFIKNGTLNGKIRSKFKQNSKYSKTFEITDINKPFVFSISAEATHVDLDCSITIPSIQTTKAQEIAQNPKPQAQKINGVDICEFRRKQALRNREIYYGEYLSLQELDYVPLTLDKGAVFAPRVECEEYKSWF